MSNITLETSTFGEQLGVYDFFNVLLSGACFLFSLLGIIYLLFPCVILSIFCDISFLGGIILAVIVFIVGLIIQEIGSIADRDIWHVKEFNYRNFLKESCTPKRILKRNHTWKYVDKIAYRQAQKSNKGNYVIHNPVLLLFYREMAKDIIRDHEIITEDCQTSDPLDDDNVNRCIFTYCEYLVSFQGKDKKVEKLRALFAMARSFATCALLIFVCLVVALGYMCLPAMESLCNCVRSSKQIVLVCCCIMPFVYYLFRCRMTKMMRYMILILMGNYNACIICLDKTKGIV